MPAWSPEIANELIILALRDGKTFNQMQLQELVYIAHGWCLAVTGQPLTGDRPEALEHGPEYRRLASALAHRGAGPVTSEIGSEFEPLKGSDLDATLASSSELSAFERNILERIYADYGDLTVPQLAMVTRSDGTPWDKVYAGGAGKNRDISHDLIQAQFADVAAALTHRKRDSGSNRDSCRNARK